MFVFACTIWRPVMDGHHLLHLVHVLIHVIQQGLPHVNVELYLISRSSLGHFANLFFHCLQVGTHTVEIPLHVFPHLLVHFGHVVHMVRPIMPG